MRMDLTMKEKLGNGAQRALWRAMAAASVALSAWLVAGEAGAASCSFTSTDAVRFGTYDVFAMSALDTTGNVTFICTGLGGSDSISIDLSAGGASSAMSRKMLQGLTPLYYNLYTDAARTQVWADGSGATSHYGPVTPPNGVTQSVTIYGRVPARQNVSVGLYADAIIATILF